MVGKSIKKILLVIPIMLVVSFILFYLLDVMPGDAATSAASAEMTAEEIIEYRKSLGLDRPTIVRYGEWLWNALHGDFGASLLNGRPVVTKIANCMPATIELSILSIVLAVVLAVPLGVLASVRRNSVLDNCISVLSMAGVAAPSFLVGIFLVLLFSNTLKWLPASGYVPFAEDPIKNLKLMIMPTIAVGIPFTATLVRQTRSAMLEVLCQDFIQTATAKGVSKAKVIWKHALRNALIPVVTVAGMQLGRLFAGAVICESIFVIPGLGKELVNSIYSRDYPVTMGLIICVALIIVVINTVIDITYGIIDPRISRSKGGK